MVDKALFLNMSAAKEVMQSMERIANNLANANTPGFRADQREVKTFSVKDAQEKWPFEDNPGAKNVIGKTVNFEQGPIHNTGRALDIALSGEGFIAVQNKQGQEAYTRTGNLQLTEDGLLTTAKGDLVLGQNGLITIAQADRISIDQKGIVSAQLIGESETEIAELGRIKLVNPDTQQLRKGTDGLFYLPEGANAPIATNVEIIPESLEGSNVEPVHALIDLIDMSRQFEYQTKIMKSLEDNDTTANHLLDVTS